MDIRHKNKILQNFKTLVQNTQVGQVLPILRERGIIPLDLFNRVQSIEDSLDRSAYLYTSILSCSIGPFDEFINVLKETSHAALVDLFNSRTMTEPCHPLANAQEIRVVRTDGTGFKPLQPETEELISQGEESKQAQIVVRKATEFKDLNTGGPSRYHMRSRNRGVYLIINNIKFENDEHSERFGALADHNNLLTLFDQMQFKGKDYRNLKLHQMFEHIKTFSQSDLLDKTDCCVVVIMSHGGEDCNKPFVVTEDNEQFDLAWVKDAFNNRNCVRLRGIPKIFIFQCCRGTPVDKAIIPEKPKGSNTAHDSKTNILFTDGAMLPTYTDILLCWSTITGFASIRESHTGTWYIQSICEVWAKWAHEYDVENLMKLVQEKIQEKLTKDNEMQTTTKENIAFRTCFLHPGLYQDDI